MCQAVERSNEKQRLYLRYTIASSPCVSIPAFCTCSALRGGQSGMHLKTLLKDPRLSMAMEVSLQLCTRGCGVLCVPEASSAARHRFQAKERDEGQRIVGDLSNEPCILSQQRGLGTNTYVTLSIMMPRINCSQEMPFGIKNIEKRPTRRVRITFLHAKTFLAVVFCQDNPKIGREKNHVPRGGSFFCDHNT